MTLTPRLSIKMTKPINFVVLASLLLAANHAVAFRSAAVGSASATARSRAAPSDAHGKRIGGSTVLNYDDSEGYEIRSDGERPDYTFGAENVPVDQRPSNEYLNLVQQPTFGWASQESGDKGLAIRLAILYVVLFFSVCYPISGATYVNEGYFLQKVAASNVGATSVVFVMVLRLYSGWGYIGSRLQSKVIEYEETGWYDGDFEEKSAAEKARDLFLYRSDVLPVVERLKKFSLAVGGGWVASCLAFNVASGANPMFNQYDPQMLEKLRYDDNVAGVVSKESNGRPTYCENRYYRAVANGGQGCD